MKAKIITACILFSVLLFCSPTFAQDPYISQFFANRAYLNPAFTGIYPGLQFNATARNQWYAADKGYSFYTVSGEWHEPCWKISGFGLMVSHAREGFAPLVTTRGAMTYNYGIGGFNAAIQYSFNQKSLDWSRFTFSDELDPVFGDIFNSAVPDGRESVWFHDFAAGVLYRWNSSVLAGRKNKFEFRSHLGFAAHHLASLFGDGPNESFLSQNSEVPARFTLHGGMIIPVEILQGANNRLLVSPNFRLESQGPKAWNPRKSLTLFSGGVYFIFMNQFTVGALYHNRSLFAGGRHTTALTFHAGFSNAPKKYKQDEYYIGLSVDVNPTGLGWQSKNAYEFNVRYTLKGLKTFCAPPITPRPSGLLGSTGCPVWN